MTNNATVEVVSDHSGNEQFGKSLTYHNAKPRKKRIVLICSLIVTVILIPALVLGPPSKESVVSGESVFTVPAITSTNPKLDLPTYSRSEALQEQDREPAKAIKIKMGGKPEKLVGPQLLKRPRTIKIPPGVMVKARLISGGSNGLVKAEIKEPLNVGGEILAEAGTLAIGSGSSSDSRLFIKFDKLVYRDGTTESVQAEAADEEDKAVGLKGSQVGFQALRLAAGIGLNFAGGAAAVLQETEGQQGAVVTKPTMKNALLNGAGKASIDQSKEMMQSLKSEAPQIKVPHGSNFYILFSGSSGG